MCVRSHKEYEIVCIPPPPHLLGGGGMAYVSFLFCILN